MKKQTFLFLTVIALFCFGNTFGQVRQNVKEAVQNQNQIRKGTSELQRDKGELIEFKYKITRLEAAFEDKDPETASIIKKDLVYAMKREIEQNANKVRVARAEVRQSQQEVNSNRRELRSDRQDLRSADGDRRDDVRDYVRDRADQADDKRDLRDDVRDSHKVGVIMMKQRKILDEIRDFQYSNETKREKALEVLSLLNQFAEMMKKDVQQTTSELSEDRAEKREDARERKDDRRERREKN